MGFLEELTFRVRSEEDDIVMGDMSKRPDEVEDVQKALRHIISVQMTAWTFLLYDLGSYVLCAQMILALESEILILSCYPCLHTPLNTPLNNELGFLACHM